jgi:NADH dehydrogenase FAD-containing subunit
VIVGGGFGGLAAAKALGKAPAEVILIDRTNHLPGRWEPRSGWQVTHKLNLPFRERATTDVEERDFRVEVLEESV